MPANLTPQYMEAERRFKEAQSIKDKIAALEEMMATIPKHKGTEKLQADLKKKMSGLRKESEQSKKGQQIVRLQALEAVDFAPAHCPSLPAAASAAASDARWSASRTIASNLASSQTP